MSENQIQKYIKSDRLSQKKLYDDYSSRLYSICLRYSSDRDTADDILQNAFIKIFKNLKTFKGNNEVSFYCWLKTIVVNTALTYLSNKHEKMQFESLDDVILPCSDYDEFNSKYDVSTEILLDIIQSLPYGYRNVFNMFVIDGYTHKEIADKLNITESTSKTQYLRAKENIKLKLKKYEHDMLLRHIVPNNNEIQ